LGIAALEDKIVQQAVVTILNQIYEVDFKGFSYGFRPGRSPHQAGEVRSGASSGEDATAGVRPFCGRGPAQAGREETGDIHVPRIYPPMWNQSEGSVHGLASDGEQADGSEAEANKADAAPPDARAAEPDRGMAAECFAGLLSVPRCAGKPSGDERFSASAAADVAKHASSSKSAAQCQLGAPRPSL